MSKNNRSKNVQWQTIVGLAFLGIVYAISILWVIIITFREKNFASGSRKSIHLVHCVADKRVVDAFEVSH